MFLTIRRFRESLLWWVVPISTISYLGLDDRRFLFLAGLSLILWFLLWGVDWAIFKIFEKVNNLDMKMMIHRYRHWMLKNRQFSSPRIDRTEERGGYDV